MEKARLGFGWMRLPQKSAETTDIDFDPGKQMVDEYMAAGFNYFDTSFVYHGGKSENAIKECLVKRKDRDSFVLTSKLPTFAITKEEQVEEIFSQQMENCGVEYFDYFLLHNLNAIRYDREVKECHMFEHMKQWKKEGKIKHIGFSFHDSADVLGRILNEHPEVEAVQIVVNYMDWDARFIQARECYETIRRNGCEVLIMEPVKGGLLANPPAEADKLLKESAKDCSAASWALRFAGGLEGVRAVISGMSNLAQVRDNIATMNNFAPLTEEERTLLKKAVRAYEAAGPLGDMDLAPFEEINPKGISAAAILETWNHCMIQPVPTFAAEQNYFSTEKAKHKIRMDEPCMPENIVLRDGRDVTELVKGAEKFLTETMFFKYEV